MSATSHRRGRGDDGFTLPELLISMVILSFIVGAIGFSLTVVLRNTRATAERTVSSLGAQALSAWFTGDIESADVTGARTAPEAATGCPDADPGTNVLLLGRADGLAVVSYRIVPADVEYELWRVVCVDGSRFHNVVVQSIAAPAGVSVTPVTLDGTTPLATVTLRVTTGTAAPSTVTVTGSPRTRDLPTPCSVVAGSPQSLPVAGGNLLQPAVFTVHVLGTCTGALALTVPTLGSPASLSVPLAPAAGGGHTGSVAVGAASWGLGTRSVTVTSDGADVGRFPVLVSDQPCTVTSATPAAFQYEPLAAPIAYDVATAGPCQSLSLSVPTGGTPATVTPGLTQLAPTQWRASLPRDHVTWSGAGRRTVMVLQAGTPVGTLAIDVTPAPCQLIAGTTAVPPRIDASGQLTGNLGVTVTTRGVCGRIGLSIPTGGAPQDPFVVTPLVGGPVAWTTTLPRPGQTWSVGDREATVLDDDQFLGTFDLAIREVCSMIGNGPSTVAVGSDGRALGGATFVVRTRGDCTTMTMRITTGGAPGTINRTLFQAGTDYSTTVQPWEATWAAPSTQTVTAFDNGNSLGSWNVSVVPCGLVAGPKQIQVTAASPQRVATDTTITVTTSGSCPQPLRVEFPTGVGARDPLPVPLTATGTANTWTGVIRPADAAWTAEVTIPRIARVYSGAAEIGTFFFVVSDCSIASADNTIDLSGNRVSSGERITFRTNGGGTCRPTMTVQFTPPGSGLQTEGAPTTGGPDYRTRTLGNLPWNNGQGPVTVSVYNSDTLFDASTLAGTFPLRGT